MSLTSALYTGVSGLLTNGAAMNVIGNNISNVNTVGYKDANSVFSDMLSTSIGNNSQVGSGVKMQSVSSMFSQGASQSSENVTDLSIQGNSFFALAAPTTAAGATTNQYDSFLSRAGSFHVDKNYMLVNADGYQVLGTDGKAIQFTNTGTAPTTDFGKITKIDSTGLITYLATDGITQNYYNGNGNAALPVATATPATIATATTLAVVTAADPSALSKVGGSLYKPTGDAGVAAGAYSVAINKPNGTSEQIMSNSLEGSNVDMASEFVKMIVTQRAYSANSKTITTTDQMTQEVLGLIR
jgi:flagellar hook protein FlgE